jgi:uncharacterized membrane protein YphA (DoxX/SURF4 family)
MKEKAFKVARILLGVIFVLSSVAALAGKIPPPEGEAAQAYMGALYGSGLLTMVSIIELVAGLALVAGYFVPFGLVLRA